MKRTEILHVHVASSDTISTSEKQRRRSVCSDAQAGLIWLFVGPTGVYLLDFFCSVFSFIYC